jgi:hypothetical protein
VDYTLGQSARALLRALSNKAWMPYLASQSAPPFVLRSSVVCAVSYRPSFFPLRFSLPNRLPNYFSKFHKAGVSTLFTDNEPSPTGNTMSGDGDDLPANGHQFKTQQASGGVT